MIQRRLEIGYNKSGRIIEGLEEIGVITPFNEAHPAHPRKVIYEQLQKLKPYIDF